MKPTIGITGRKNNPLGKETAKLAIDILEKKQVKMEIDKAFLGKGKPLKEFRGDLILSFGGDGTLLSVYREINTKIPVMGINCGNRGYLQAYSHTEIEFAIENVLRGKYSIENRTRIKAKVDGKNVGEALNEALVVPHTPGRILRYTLGIGKEERKEAGDGLIVATPTGSTAHALSAGGPQVKGNAKVLVVVSMNPIDWKHRPLIINDHEKVTVSGFEKGKADLILDGQKRFIVKKKVELEKGNGVLLATK